MKTEWCHPVGLVSSPVGGAKFCKSNILSIRGLPLTLVKMGIYGGICANMAEYVQKIAKLCKPGAKTGGMGGITLYVLYIFLHQNSMVLTSRRNGGMKTGSLAVRETGKSQGIPLCVSRPGKSQGILCFYVKVQEKSGNSIAAAIYHKWFVLC